MDSEIIIESLPIVGMCSLCLTESTVRSMLLPHKYNEVNEIYAELLKKCYNIDLSQLELGDTKQMICESCVLRLRDATLFREQVETSIQTLKTLMLSSVKDEDSIKMDFWQDDCTQPEFGSDDNTDVKDNAPLKSDGWHDEYLKLSSDGNVSDTSRKIKTERKSTDKKTHVKIKSSNHRKKADLKNTESLLKSGLFPFKMSRNKTPFSCAACAYKSMELDDIKFHCKSHTKKNLDIAFDKLMFSKQQYHRVGDKLRCKICTTDITDYEHLKNHIENCTRIKAGKLKWSHLPFKLEKDQLDCPICKKKFVNFVTLNSHMNVHFPNFICENCGKAYASKARLRGHVRTHEVGEFPCKYCDQVFDIVTKREHHVSKDHKSGIRYACKRCNISLGSFYARQKHLAEVHNEDLKRYKCKACPQSYITPGHLSSHVRRDHLNERNHKCPKCDLAFYTKNALKMHLIKHDGERIHTCNVCQKSYQRKKTLIEHLRIHNNDKRFVCPVCGRAFTQKCTLKGHMRVHERKYVLMT